MTGRPHPADLRAGHPALCPGSGTGCVYDPQHRRTTCPSCGRRWVSVEHHPGTAGGGQVVHHYPGAATHDPIPTPGPGGQLTLPY